MTFKTKVSGLSGPWTGWKCPIKSRAGVERAWLGDKNEKNKENKGEFEEKETTSDRMMFRPRWRKGGRLQNRAMSHRIGRDNKE